MSDDDELHEFDLSAWDAPAPPSGLAEGVIARVHAADAAIAVAMQRRSRKHWWLAGGVTAGVAALALGTWLVWPRGSSDPSDGSTTGELMAVEARHLDLGDTSVNVELGTEIRWSRTGGTLHVHQLRGNATWLVGGDDHVVIDAGSASVDATAANLRLEVAMNMTDVRVIGASAATAAAVAMVTVVVYEGHVKATSASQTTVVVPGTTVEVKPNEPPHEKLAVGATNPTPVPPLPTVATAELALTAGESVTIHDPNNKTTVEFVHGTCPGQSLATIPSLAVAGNVVTFPVGHYSYELKCDNHFFAYGEVDVVDDANVGGLPVAIITQPVDGAVWPDPIHIAGRTVTDASVSIGGRAVLVNSDSSFAGDLPAGDRRSVIALRVVFTHHVHYFIRRAGVDHTVTDHTLTNYDFSIAKLDRAAIDRTIKEAKPKLAACNQPVGFDNTLKMAIRIAASGDVTSAEVQHAKPFSVDVDKIATCARDVVAQLHFPASKAGGSIVYPLVFPAIAPKPPSCDADALREAGTNSEAMGAHNQALKQFEDAFKCKPDPHTLQLTFMVACNAHNVQKARTYWVKMSPEIQNRLAPLCVRNNISRTVLDANP